jgi:hypothetical protein
VPYLNGGLFLPHKIEEAYASDKDYPGDLIEIPNEAFIRPFDFFGKYNWHLDVSLQKPGNEINPDVLGFIFEKYINQKEMGAYYTKEDITGYICKNTILPFLLEKVGIDVRVVMQDVDPYIDEAVSTTERLPTETDREYAARRARYGQIKADFAAGKITTVNDLITYNLDILEFTFDWLRGLTEPHTLQRFYFECLVPLTILDPTCGSGAFLFAAMNILEPLYDIALDKMRHFIAEAGETARVKYLQFDDELKRVAQHPNPRYFVFKSIIINNLYGGDIMDEAVEICKLRLFLKLVAQLDEDDANTSIEPLPDIDFNVRTGNTLVGFAKQSEINGRLFATPELKRKVAEADRGVVNFRSLQTRVGVEAKMLKTFKKEIQAQLDVIREDLDHSLMEDYGLSDLSTFRKSHQPFHWYVEFNAGLANGGFDVIVGNPPYVEYSKVKRDYSIRGYDTEKSNNLYAYVIELCTKICSETSRIGMIIPLSAFCTQRMAPLLKTLRTQFNTNWISHYAWRPAKLFDNVNVGLSIFISSKQGNKELFSTTYQKWTVESREFVVPNISYVPVMDMTSNFIVPKFGQNIELSIGKKLWRVKPTLGYLMSRQRTNHVLHYRNTGGLYWKIITDFQPEFFEDGVQTRSSVEANLYFNKASDLKVAVALLSSGLFWWYHITYSDCRHITPYDLETLPLGIFSEEEQAQLERLSARLMSDYRANCVYKERTHKGKSTVRYQEFHPRLSKPIIDQIDRVLAKHYGFNAEELDFIINYDVKYRMGKDADAEGDE